MKQLEFPGFKIERVEDEEPPRLKIETSIKIQDTYTGEVVTFKIPAETDDEKVVHDLVTQAVEHHRTKDNISSFCKGRRGGIDSGETDNEEVKGNDSRKKEGREETVSQGL